MQSHSLKLAAWLVGIKISNCLEFDDIGGESIFGDVFRATEDIRTMDPRPETLATVSAHAQYLGDGGLTLEIKIATVLSKLKRPLLKKELFLNRR